MNINSCKKVDTRKNKRVKLLVLTLTVLLMFGGMIGGTIAWLTDDTEPVTNTFTDSDIEVTLTETKKDFKMIPGWTIDKDPVVTVKAGSEDCWVFLEVTESTEPLLSDYITYAIDKNWTLLEKKDVSQDGEIDTYVYFCKVTDVTSDRAIKVLGYYDSEEQFHNNQVLVNESVTKEMMDKIDDANEQKPTLTFKAYAVQMYKNNTETFEPEEAWEKIQAATPTPTP